MDIHSKAVRSYNMSQIKNKDTKPETMVRKFLFSQGFRYRKNDNRLPGRPDIVLPKYKTIVFINGCFWHMHDGCKYSSIPKTNTEFWRKKLTQNKSHDEDVYNQLASIGWNVIVLWQCELRGKNFEPRMAELVSQIRSTN